MTKLPFMQFFPDLWLRDTRKLSPLAKAVWIDVIAYCWNEPQRGIYQRSLGAMSRELGIAETDMSPILDELSRSGVADISRTSTGDVLVMSRRIRNIESKREYERKKKARQRRPAGVPDVSLDVPPGCPQDVPGEMLDVRRQTSDVTKEKEKKESAASDAAHHSKSQKPKRPPVLNWQDLVEHINSAWKQKKGAAYPWDDHEFKKLRGLAITYQAPGVMAMFDLYIQMQTYWGKLTGYMIDGLKKDIGVIVDDPRWKPLSKKYDDQLIATAKPTPEMVSINGLIADLTGSAKKI